MREKKKSWSNADYNGNKNKLFSYVRWRQLKLIIVTNCRGGVFIKNEFSPLSKIATIKLQASAGRILSD